MKSLSPQNSSSKSMYEQPEKIIMYPTPGYKFAQACASYSTNGQAIRALFVINNILYIVCGNSLLSFTPTGTGYDLTSGVFSVLGKLKTSSGVVYIECNTVQLIINDALYGYIYTLSSAVFAAIGTTGSFPLNGITNLTYYDGYAIGAVNASQEIVQSNVLDGATWGAQAFDKITSFVDDIVAVFSDELILYIFGPKITEVQYDNGTIPYAFIKQAGVLIQAGCLAPATIKKVANTILWLASDIAGSPFVAALQSYAADPVSTAPINEFLARLTAPQIAAAYSWTYREAENHFYCITVGGVTWSYDIKMKQWHERSIAGGADIPTAYVYWQGNHVVGDANGNLLLMSQNYSTYYDNTTQKDIPLMRQRVCQHLNADGKTMFLDELWIEMQQGGGFISDTQLLNQPVAAAPLATLEISKNYGNTWINVGTRSMGTQGQYLTRVLWRKLGRFRQNITFRLTITDPVQTFILGARANIRVGIK